MLILATTRCNLSCTHCLGNFTQNGVDISVSDFKFALDQLKGVTPAIILSGGEPFLHPEITELIALALNKKFLVTVTTNGTLIGQHKQFLKSAIRNGLFVQITYDSRYYNQAPDYSTANELGIPIIDRLPSLSQIGRAKTNNIAPYGHVASLCANPILIAHQTHDFPSMIATLNICKKFCAFAVHPNLDLYLSECHTIKLSNLRDNDWQSTAYNKLLLKNQTQSDNIFCDKCGLSNSVIFDIVRKLTRK